MATTPSLTETAMMIRKYVSYGLVCLLAMQSIMAMSGEYLIHGQLNGPQIQEYSSQTVEELESIITNAHRSAYLSTGGQRSLARVASDQLVHQGYEHWDHYGDHQYSDASDEAHCCDCHSLVQSFLLLCEGCFSVQASLHRDLSEYLFSSLSNLTRPALRPPIVHA